MFVGARGLSYEVDCDEVFEIICSVVGENSALNASKPNIFFNKSQLCNRIISIEEDEKYCPICLSYKDSLKNKK
jgi:hypothetical protein